MTPTPVPTLDAVNGDTVRALPRDVALALIVRAASIQAVLAAWVAEAPVAPDVPTPVEGFISKVEAAHRLGMAPGTLAHKARHFPWSTFRVTGPGRMPQYHAGRIAAYLRDPEAYTMHAGSDREDPIGLSRAGQRGRSPSPGSPPSRAPGRWGSRS